MPLSERASVYDDVHPIDLVETLAAHHDWTFDRVTDDQIAMSVEGQWRTYGLTMAWSAPDETLRLVCSFEMEPPVSRIGALYEMLNVCNDRLWTGAFSYWTAEKLMVWRYGLLLAGGQVPGTEQIERLVGSAVTLAERFYPAFQLVVWADKTPDQALQVAIAETCGRA